MATRLPRGERPYKLTLNLTNHARINAVLKEALGRKFTVHEMLGMADYHPELARTLIDFMEIRELTVTTRDRLAQLQYRTAESALEAYMIQQGQEDKEEVD